MKWPWQKRDEELDEEIRMHLEMTAREREERGESADDARTAARREFGNVGLVKETTREMWGWTRLEQLWQDVRFGLRMMRRNPGFATVAVITLALGIGATTAIFSVVNAVVLQPLPFPQEGRLVSVEYFDTIRQVPQGAISYPDFFDWRRQNHLFMNLTAFHDAHYTLTGVEQPAHLNGAVVTSDFFSTLEVAPRLGRGFLPGEEQRGTHVVVLSDTLWRSVFAADPYIVGRDITLDNKSYTVVGVAPRSFDFPIATPPVQLWTTCADDYEMLDQRGADFLSVVARLKPQVTIAQAQADIGRIAANLAKQYPQSNLHTAGAFVEPELQRLVGNVAPALFVLLGAVACVLLMACANVANLLLARSTTRRKEMALRSALGAGRARVIRQLLTESISLASLGAGAGALLADWGIRGLVQLIPGNIPRMSQIQMDSRVFVFTLLTAVLAGIVFGLAPALQCYHSNFADSLKGGSGDLSGSIHANHLRSALIVSEVALALPLLMGAGLMIQSLARLQNVDPGFNPHHVLTFRFSLPSPRYNTDQQKIFYELALDRLNAVAGVQSAAAAVTLPLSGDSFFASFSIQGRSVAKGNEPVEELGVVSPGYFRTTGIPLLEGRDFAPTDAPNSPNVVVVNEAFAKRYFPNEDPIGKRMTPGLSDSDVPNAPKPMREIIGVVGDVKTRALSHDAAPEYFLPYQQALVSDLYMVLRTKAAPESVLGAARDAIRAMDSSLPIYGVSTTDQCVRASVTQPRFSALLLSIFAALALSLAGLGLYGVISYSVAQRSHEIGIRMALGAQQSNVLRDVIKESSILVGIGLVIGILLALSMTWIIASQLFGVSSMDPVTMALAAGCLSGVACVATAIPARRATRVDPMVALRYE